ncbi:hypothetical protein SAMN04488561_4487 [Jiangella alba]|uniref:Uncharacterized protein n=1 Tax=Jiangella alba TaxID=561176 RepID=A0A1H5PJI6_9ACTN|nr:hypothetical protein SAMN04488561_4487 [Jiangella alba]
MSIHRSTVQLRRKRQARYNRLECAAFVTSFVLCWYVLLP